MVATRRSLAQQAAQNSTIEPESVAEPPAKPAVLNAADKKTERKRKAEDVKEESEAVVEEAVKQPLSELPQKTVEKSKRAKRRHRGATKRQDEGRTREGQPRPETEENIEES